MSENHNTVKPITYNDCVPEKDNEVHLYGPAYGQEPGLVTIVFQDRSFTVRTEEFIKQIFKALDEDEAE